MKRMMAVCMSLFLLLVSGCSESRTYPQITLDPGNGEVKSISLDDAIAKKDDGENFHADVLRILHELFRRVGCVYAGSRDHLVVRDAG